MNKQQADIKADPGSANTLPKKDNSRRQKNLNLEQRRELTIRRAVPLFLDKGYDNVSMNDVIDAAGGSKATIYALFGNKEGLFEEVVRWIAAETSVMVNLTGATGSIEERLRAMGMAFLETVLHPRIIELHRLMVSLGRTFPSATSGFYAAGPDNAYRLVADWITEHQEAGEIRPGDAHDLAALFLDMLIGEFQLSILTGAMKRPTAKQIKARVDVAVNVFLAGCATQPRAPD